MSTRKDFSNCFTVIRGHIPDVFIAPWFWGVLNMGVQFFRMPSIFFVFPHHTKQKKNSVQVFTIGDALNLRL
jgi:hypothetical protein